MLGCLEMCAVFVAQDSDKDSIHLLVNSRSKSIWRKLVQSLETLQISAGIVFSKACANIILLIINKIEPIYICRGPIYPNPSTKFMGKTAVPTIPGPVCTPKTGEIRKTSSLPIWSRAFKASASSSALSGALPCKTDTHKGVSPYCWAR